MSCSRLHLLLTFGMTVSFMGIACADERITLRCTGSSAFKEMQFERTPAPDQSLIIDFDQGSVTGSLGSFEITSVSETSIAFSVEPRSPNIKKITGGVDRLSGAASVVAWVDDKRIAYFYDLSCKPANPLF